MSHRCIHVENPVDRRRRHCTGLQYHATLISSEGEGDCVCSLRRSVASETLIMLGDGATDLEVSRSET